MPSKDNFTITTKMPKGKKDEVVTLEKNNNKNRNKNL